MQSLVAKLAALALLAAGFALTGDLRRLVERGTRFLDAAGGPAGTPAETPIDGPATRASVLPRLPPEPRDAPLGRQVDVPRLPTSTLDTVDLRALVPGTRLTVWVGTPPVAVAFEVVDSAAGEVLEQSAAPSGGGPLTVPRRLRLEAASSRPLRIERGGMLRLTPLGVAHGSRPAGPAEPLGPVRALEVR